MENQHTHAFYVWISSPQSQESLNFIQLLQGEDNLWRQTERADEAHLWCVEYANNDYQSVIDLYNHIAGDKPRVIVLAKRFIRTPDKRWIFFKTPINKRILHAWLNVNFHRDTLSSSSDLTYNTEAVWSSGLLKLQYWPNMSAYPDDTDLMMVCSALLHDWQSREALLRYGIDAALLDRLLADAMQEGNLLHREGTQDTADHTHSPSNLFKRLLGKFSKR